MTVIITRLPASDADDPTIWRITDGVWQDAGPLLEYLPLADEDLVMALVAPADARTIFSALPDLEPRQAEGVARLRAIEHSIGPVHAVARHVIDDVILSATISPIVMEYGLVRLAARGLNPDIVIPAGFAVNASSEYIVRAEFDGMIWLRGPHFAIPEEPALRELLVGDKPVNDIEASVLQEMLATASALPLLNLRAGVFAKREHTVWATPLQRRWIKRLIGGLVTATIVLGLVIWTKYKVATGAENDRALAAAQKIDSTIGDITVAETQLDRSLQQKGIAKGRFAPLSSGLWRSVKAAPNVTVQEFRFGTDGILTVALAAPNAASIDTALIAIQQDGYKVTATPRQDSTGATLVELTMRMP